MGPLSNRVKVQIYFYDLPIEMDNFDFDVKVIQGLKSTLNYFTSWVGGWVGRWVGGRADGWLGIVKL